MSPFTTIISLVTRTRKAAPATRRTRIGALSAALLAALLAACGGSGDGGTGPGNGGRTPVASVEVWPGERQTEVGQTFDMVAFAKDAAGEELEGRTIAWSSTNESVLTVSEDGTVTALAEGQAFVRATSEGKVGSARIVVTRVTTDPNPAPAPTVASIDPVQVNQEWPEAFTMTVTGEHFTSRSTIHFDGQPRETIPVNATTLLTRVDPSDLRDSATIAVTVTTPGPGGGTSGARTFRVNLIPVAQVDIEFVRGGHWTWTGETVVLRAVPRDHQGRALRDRAVAWASERPATVSIDERGIALASAQGQAVISATIDGTVGRKPIDVFPAPAYDLVYGAGVGDDRHLRILRPGSAASPFVLPIGIAAWDPSPSPDGSRIAFTGQAADRSVSVYVYDRAARTTTRLTTGASLNDEPAWSPDGTRIAFRSTRAGASDIWVMDADGDNARRLTTASTLNPQPGSGQASSRPAWSPDSRRIVYSSSMGGDADLWIMNADGSAKERLTSGDAGDLDPSWSANGDVVSFRRENGFRSRVVMLHLPNRSEIVQINPAGDGRAPVLSPDGGFLVYSGPETQGAALQVMPAAGVVPARTLVARSDPAQGATGGMDAAWVARRQ
jgi:dipeptidyl aminopeptidase/acylaminoacyl peptidase